MRKVFLSYSHRDRELVGRFRTHLVPWERNGELELWVDEVAIEPGDGWDEEIRSGIRDADTAVVVVSPDLLASDYVNDVELPLLMQAAEAGRLRLAPLFLEDAAAHVRAIPLAGGVSKKITDYQGLNEPSEPIATLPESQQNTALRRCAEKLAEIAGEATRERRPPGERAILTVDLRRERGTIKRVYYRMPPHELDATVEPEDPRLARAIEAAERAGGASASLAASDLGELLWRTLFGSSEASWKRILRRSTGEAEPRSPIAHPHRIRIAATDAGLRALPWSLARWDRYELADQDWTFELAPTLEPPRRIERLHRPSSALMIAAEPATQELGVRNHHLDFKGLLATLWDRSGAPPLPDPVTTAAEVKRRRASGTAPRLLYLYARASASSDASDDDERGGLVLELADGSLPFSELAQAWRAHPPQIVLLNTVGDCPLAPPTPELPLLLHHREPSDPARARRFAQAWWREVLGGADPVQALHDQGPEAWSRAVAQTHYEEWEVEIVEPMPRAERVRDVLDRIQQRGQIRTLVLDLLTSKKVVCLLAYGPRGNLASAFFRQMTTTLRDEYSSRFVLDERPLLLPEEGDGFTLPRLREAFKEGVALEGDDLDAAFRLRRRAGGDATPLFLLDWGSYGADGETPAPSGKNLGRWLEFCQRELERPGGDRVRILSYVGLELNGIEEQEMEDWAELKRVELRRDHFDFQLLPQLRPVRPTDLANFLESDSRCPRELLEELPERIHHHTGGDFDKTAALLEEAERNLSWYELMETLAPPPARRTSEAPF